ncbi:helix-turn-helix domain-containing protein [Kitasatospora purpeofusca]|uniref:helix-turn-helix domain-containing protein n=1 Tax=Kitasatospora purpeofusca TaxID=67352 RepID=UPI002256FA1D|nr:helix-turn-helix transcriptional regulator [Kitasatospora purpeofusca]WSR36526.1 helix-turn-helix domain-containing protein [Kitasatospora purpeofusca]
MAVIEPRGDGRRQTVPNSMMHPTTWRYRRITGPKLLKRRAMTDFTPDTVGKRIKQTRKLRHMTQTELALKAKISASHMAQIEQGKRQAGPAVLASIARALSVPRPAARAPRGAARRFCHDDAGFRSSKTSVVQSETRRSRLGQAVADQAKSVTDDQSEKSAKGQHRYEQTSRNARKRESRRAPCLAPRGGRHGKRNSSYDGPTDALPVPEQSSRQ